MNRSKVNYLIDIGLLVTFIPVFVTGVIKFPLWTQFFNPVYLFIASRTMNMIHDWAGLVMSLLVLVHLALHWRWLVTMTKRMLRRNR